MYGSTDGASTSSPSKGSSIASCVINLANTIIGAGMLGLPGAFGGTGYMSGIILLIIAAMFSAHGLFLLSASAQIAGLPSSFYSVAHAAFPRYTILIDLAVALKCFGVATGYLITISDSMVNALDHILLTGDPLVDDNFFTNIVLSRRFWVVGALISVLPFSFYKTLDELKKASSLALVFVFMLVVMIIFYANDIADPCMGQEEELCRGDMVAFTDFPSTVSKIPIFVFAFTCQQNIFPIVNEIELLSQRRINLVIIAAIGFALVIFSVVAMEGYLTFGSYVRGDILLNYPENRNVTILRVCIAFMLALHYPLQLDPSRRCITSLLKVSMEWWESQKSNQRLPKILLTKKHSSCVGTELRNTTTKYDRTEEKIIQDEFSYNEIDPMEDNVAADSERMFFRITICFLGSSFILAMIVDDLGIVLALVGATGSTLVSYVLPGLIYLKLHDQSSRVMAWAQLTVGICVIPLALYYILTKQVVH
jgi:amino acid permease